MPWRAGQVYGHLGRTALLYASTPRTSICRSLVVIQPFHQSIASKCPAAAVALSVQIPSLGDARNVMGTGDSIGGPIADGGPQRDPVSKVKSGRDARDDDPKHPLGETIDGMFLCLSKTGSLPAAEKSSKRVALLDHLSRPNGVVGLAKHMAATRKPHRALRVLVLSQVLGHTLKQHGYESVAYQLAQLGHWPLVASLVELARRQSGRTTLRLLNWRARALVSMEDFAALNRVLDIFEQEQVRPDRRTFHIIVSGHLRNRDLARAKRCIAAMEEAGIEVDASTHALIIASYRQFGLAHSVRRKALDVLDESDDRSATNILNSLVQQSLDRDDIQGAARYLAFFNPSAASLAFDVGFIQQDGDVPPLMPVDSHRRNTLSQDTYTFTILINYLAKQADLPRALRIFQRMRETGVPPDSSTVAALVRAHFAAGRALAAIRIVASMCQKRRVGALFEQLGLAEVGNNEPSLLPAGITPTAEVFNALVRGILATRGLNGMDVALRIMKSCDVIPDERTAHILLLHLDKVERASPRDIMRQFRRLLPRHVVPAVSHLNVILRSIMRREGSLRREINRTPPLESSTPSEGVETDSLDWDRVSGTIEDSYDPAAGLEITRRLSYRAQAQPILRSLVAREVRSDRATYALRLRHDAVVKRDLEMAKRSFQAMINRGLHPNEYHFGAIMEGYAVIGDVEGAMAVMDSALKEGVRPNVQLYTILLLACVRRKNPRRALHVFRTMLAAGVQPDIIAVHTLTRAFLAAGRKKDARRRLLRLWTMVADIPEGLDPSASAGQLLKVLMSVGLTEHKGEEPTEGQNPRGLRWKVNKVMQRWKKSTTTGPSCETSDPSDAKITSRAVSSHPTNETREV